MKTPPLLLALLTCGASLVFAESSAYDAATANNPNYSNKEVWPNLTGKERFLKQKFPPGRVMEWAKPGKNVGGRDGLDVWDPANWLQDGKPATEVKFDENTDLVLPDSDTPYNLDLKRVEGWEPVYRNVTVGRNADILYEGARYFGNIWIKKGGVMNARHSNAFYGDQDTFVRDDNGTYEEADSGRIGQYFFLRKSPDASLEIVGNVSMLDRVPIDSGTLIIGPDCRFSPGRNATMVIGESATVALLDGARVVKWVNQIGQLDLIVFGTLQGGLPERPLTRPAYVELSYQNTTGVPFFDRLPQPAETVRSLESRVASMSLGSKAVIRSISETPEGMLHLRWSGIDPAAWHLNSHGPAGDWQKSLSEEQQDYLKTQLAAIPKKLTVIVQHGVQIDGLVLNDMHAGGLLMEDPKDAATWKRIIFGERNEATGNALISRIARATINDNVKNPGGDYQLGVPVTISSHEIDGDAKKTYEFKDTIPASAAGKRLGIRFARQASEGWTHIDNVVLKIGGKDWIMNGDFEAPKDLKMGKKAFEMTQVPGWQNMSQSTSNVGVGEGNEGRFGAFYGNNTSFGQTTEYVARGGETIELTFSAKVAKGPVLAEIYSLDEGH